MSPFITGCIIYFGLLILLSTIFRQRLTGFLDFFLAGKHLPMWMMTISVLAAWIGAASTMGTMTLAYTEGISAYWLLAVPTVTAMCVNGFVLAKAIRQSEFTTIPEAIAKHYGPVASLAYAVVIYMATTTLIGSQLVACGGLFQNILGLSMQQSLPWIYFAIVTYSIIGGFRAVVLTDLVQFAVLFLGMFITAYFAQQLPVISPQAVQPTMPGVTQLSTFWLTNLPQHLAMTLTFTLSWSIAPELWQRLAALPKATDAKKMVLWATLVFLIFFTMVVMTGYWAKGRIETIDVRHIKTGSNVFFLLVSKMPNALISTTMLVGVVAAIASTIDSSLNVACMTISKDIISRFIRPGMSSQHEILLSRLATLVVGLPAMAVALFYQDLVKILWISADIYASAAFIPVLGLFYLKRGRNPLSGAFAILFGLVPVLLQFFGHDLALFPLPIWWPGAPYTTLIGIGMCALGYGLGILLNPRIVAIYRE